MYKRQVFDGWYKDEACTEPADTKVTLNSDVTVYAKWKAKEVNYTIAYFKQVWNNETNSASYVYDSSEVKTAEVGTSVTGSNAKSFDYYSYKGSDRATVKADGSTVVKVYYDLIKDVYKRQADPSAFI